MKLRDKRRELFLHSQSTIFRAAAPMAGDVLRLWSFSEINDEKRPAMMSDSDRADQMGQATREKLRQFIARIERLEAEKAELAADIRDVYGEMKTFGLDTKVMRKVIALRKQDAAERAEQEALLELYLEASDGV